MSSYSAGGRKGKVPSKIPQFSVNLEHVLGFTSISNSAVAQNHSTIAYVAGSTTILYNKETLKQDFIINRARKAITSISLSSDGRYLATGESGHDPKIRIWDLAGDRKSCIELGDHQFAIESVCFSTKTSCLVSIGSMHDGYICVWNWQDKTKLASNKCLVSIRRIAFTEDGSRFVTVGNRHVKFWNFISKPAHGASPLRGNEPILGEYKDNCFTDIACGRGSYADLTWTLTTNGLICQFDKDRKLLAHRNLQKKTNCLAIGNSNLVVGCDKGVVYIISLQNLESIISIPLPHCLGVDIGFATPTNQMKSSQQPNISFPNVIAICVDEVKSLLTCFYNDHSFYIWDIKNIQSIEKLDAHMYHSEGGWAIETYSRTSELSSSLDQLAMITSSSDNTVRFWSLNQDEINSASSQIDNTFREKLMKVIYLDKDHSKEKPSEIAMKVGSGCMKMSPDGLSLVIGDLNGNIHVFDMQTFKQTACIQAHDSEVLSVDFGQSIDMNVTFLASSGSDRLIHIYDVSRNYQLITTLTHHTGAVTAVRFTLASTTSKLGLISCSADKSLIFQSISRNENGKYQFVRSHSICEHQRFYDLTVDHQNKHIHTTCQDRITRVYNIEDGKKIRTWKDPTNENVGHLIKIDIDVSGRYLATSCSNKDVYLWGTKTPECIVSLCGHGKVVTDLKFSHDGRRLYTIAGDSCIFVWKLDSSLSNCRSISEALPKTDDRRISEASETMPQTLNVTDEYQSKTECQQSLSVSPELPPIQKYGTESTEESFGSMIGPKDNESVISIEDFSLYDDTNSNNLDNSNETASSLLIKNYSPENQNSDTLIDDANSKRHQLERQISISSKFRQLLKEIGLSDTLPTEDDGPTSMQTSESTVSETVDDMETKALPSVSSTSPKTSSDTLNSESVHRLSTSLLNHITEQRSDLETNPTIVDLEARQDLHSTDDLRTYIQNDNDNSLIKIKMQHSLSISDLGQMQQEEVGSSTSIVGRTINDQKQHDSMNCVRMSIVNDLTNELFTCLDNLDNLYEVVTKSLDTQDTILRKSIERTYSDLHRRIINNQKQQNKES